MREQESGLRGLNASRSFVCLPRGLVWVYPKYCNISGLRPRAGDLLNVVPHSFVQDGGNRGALFILVR